MTALAYLWYTASYGNDPYFDALFPFSWLMFFVFSQHYTTLKGRPARVQAVLIGGQTAILMAIALVAAALNNN